MSQCAAEVRYYYGSSGRVTRRNYINILNEQFGWFGGGQMLSA